MIPGPAESRGLGYSTLNFTDCSTVPFCTTSQRQSPEASGPRVLLLKVRQGEPPTLSFTRPCSVSPLYQTCSRGQDGADGCRLSRWIGLDDGLRGGYLPSLPILSKEIPMRRLAVLVLLFCAGCGSPELINQDTRTWFGMNDAPPPPPTSAQAQH